MNKRGVTILSENRGLLFNGDKAMDRDITRILSQSQGRNKKKREDEFEYARD